MVYQGIIGTIIFMLFQVVGTELIFDYVNVALTNDIVDGITLINIITWFSLIGLFAAMTITNILTFKIQYPLTTRTEKPFRSLISTWLITFLFTFTISVIGLTQFPNFAITVGNFPLIPTLFMIFVLKNPAIYIGMIAIIFIVWNFMFNVGLGVETS